MEKEKIRAFISIDLPKKIQREIEKIQRSLPTFKGKLTEPENLHLTLKFLGEIDEEILIEIKRRLREIEFKEFETEIDNLGIFDNRRSRIYSRKIIVWLHLSDCIKLQKLIDQKLEGLFEKEHRFMSHLTIARIKNLKNKKYFFGELRKLRIQKGLKFRVREFVLKKSTLTPEGPLYEDLEVFSLD